MKKHLFTIGIVLLCLLMVGAIFWVKAYQTTPVSGLDPDTVTLQGLHVHPELAIFVKGEAIEIPQNIGLGMIHKPIHTHDDLPIIHLEFPGKVTRDDTRLGKFFEIWGKDFQEFGQTVTMTINGQPNAELENYEMKDGDKIELRYE